MSARRPRATKKTAPRRTQLERRTETIRKLTDATIESLLAVGYARTTVKEICTRASLSHGALFRFFPTLLDLVLAAAEEVARRQIADFERRFESARRGPDALGTALTLLREACRAPLNMVFYELLVASRTDAALRKALKPGVQRYFEAIRASARTVPGVADLPAEEFETLLFTIIHLFDGESLVRGVVANPPAEKRRLELLKLAVGLVAAGATQH